MSHLVAPLLLGHLTEGDLLQLKVPQCCFEVPPYRILVEAVDTIIFTYCLQPDSGNIEHVQDAAFFAGAWAPTVPSSTFASVATLLPSVWIVWTSSSGMVSPIG